MSKEKKADEKSNVSVFNTHKYLYSLNYEGEVKGKKIIYLDRDNKEKEIIIDKIEISSNPISCKIFDSNGNYERIAFFRIKRIFDENGELIWEGDNNASKNVKIIKGYK